MRDPTTGKVRFDTSDARMWQIYKNTMERKANDKPPDDWDKCVDYVLANKQGEELFFKVMEDVGKRRKEYKPPDFADRPS